MKPVRTLLFFAAMIVALAMLAACAGTPREASMAAQALPAAENLRGPKGRVVSAKTGKPIEGAVVELITRRGVAEERETVTTNARGEYAFSNQFYGSWNDLLRVRKRGYATLAFNPDRMPGRLALQDFSLPPGGVIEGRVVSPERVPIAGARVGGEQLGVYSQIDAMRGHVASAEAVTGPDGRFRLEGLPKGKSFALPAVADGFLPTVSNPVPVGFRDVELTLEPSQASLTGRVLLGSGDDSPVPGVTVRLTPAHNSLPSYMHTRAHTMETVTDGQGRFRFGAVPVGMQFNLSAGIIQGSAGTWARTDVTISAPGEVVADLRGLIGTVNIKATARSIADGSPVAGVAYSWHRELAETFSGADGTFSVTREGTLGEAASNDRIPVWPPDGWLVRQTRLEPATFSYTDPPSEVAVEVLLAPAVMVEGMVLGPDGNPVARASLRTARDTWYTDNQGLFRIPVEATEATTLEASSEDGWACHELPHPGDGSVPFQTIWLEPAASV